jgi:formylglycine-generating enzyme required for sulfatase activity
MKRKLTLILIAGFIAIGFWQLLAPSVYSQNKRLTLWQIKNSLTVSNDRAKESAITAKKVRQVGVTFILTPEIEAELRAYGATNELIKAIRQKSPPLPTSKITSTVRGNGMKNSIGMEFVKLPSGEFMMGSTDAEIDEALYECKKYYAECKREYFTPETPKHRVTINYEFYMGKFEVTQGQW